ncbi:MAG: branched-chain amino acid ABC transporter permease [Desulfobacteraceae bacterium]|nr:branched-chain amino acid ABC transporter permease [Desulfobacteraceae bacterium]
MSRFLEQEVTCTMAGAARGARAIWPVAVAVLPFGITFGVSAGEAGIDPSTSLLMSALVFAGAAQFAVLDLWSSRIPLIPLVLTLFAVNARNIIMGASLHPWIGRLPAHRIAMITPVLSDANWAVSMDAYGKGERDVGILLGSGLLLWFTWVAGTGLGACFTGFVIAPERLGLDLLMPVFFVTVLMGMGKQKGILLPWATAAMVSLAISFMVEGNWHIIAGALAGGIAGVLHDTL